MTDLVARPDPLRSLLSPFGALRSQPAAGWIDDPIILDRGNGTVLHAHHGEGVCHPVSLFPDVFAMGATFATIGTVHDEAGPDLLDDDRVLRLAWRVALRTRLVPFFGSADVERAAVQLGW